MTYRYGSGCRAGRTARTPPRGRAAARRRQATDRCSRPCSSPPRQSALRDGIDINAPGASDRRPLHRAVGAGHLDIISFLVERGASVDQPDKSGRTPLHWAAMTGSSHAVELLLRLGADPFMRSKSGKTTVHVAADSGKPESLAVLLAHVRREFGDDRLREVFNTTDRDGRTPFDLAKAGQYADVLETLRGEGDPNAQSCCVVS